MDVAPSTRLAVPATQLLQVAIELALVAELQVPAVQLVHRIAAGPLQVPGAQGEHDVAPAPLKKPAVQLVHEVAPRLSVLKVPAVQVRQLVAPVEGWNCPAPHWVHDDEPAAGLKVPATQLVQGPPTTLVSPAAQAVQTS
jgi:hypothetical protein